MTLQDFRECLKDDAPPEGLSRELRAMWEDAKGRWDQAHTIAQDIGNETGSWIHAYLHRKEGDLGDAGYWYRRARQPVAHGSLDAEWDHIVSALLRP
jgi:hypothetical protein